MNQFLLTLYITKDITDVTVKEVNAAFRKLAKVTHPDKSGDDNTAKFQVILEAYKKLNAYFKETESRDDKDVVDIEEKFFRENFELFNFPHANKGSFTVGIEDTLADTWQECMASNLGEPSIIMNEHGTECDRLWKVNYKMTELTIHLYNNPKNKKGSKIMIQAGRQSVICSYVFEELPRIYDEVCQKKPKTIKKISRVKTNSKPFVKCDLCKFKSSLLQMKMHIKSVHGSMRTAASKRLQDFTPLPAKKVRKAKKLAIDQISHLNTKEYDNSLLRADDSFSEKNPDVFTIEEIEQKQKPEPATILQEDLYLMNISLNEKVQVENEMSSEEMCYVCTLCAKTFVEETELENHLQQIHNNLEQSIEV